MYDDCGTENKKRDYSKEGLNFVKTTVGFSKEGLKTRKMHERASQAKSSI